MIVIYIRTYYYEPSSINLVFRTFSTSYYALYSSVHDFEGYAVISQPQASVEHHIAIATLEGKNFSLRKKYLIHQQDDA